MPLLRIKNTPSFLWDLLQNPTTAANCCVALVLKSSHTRMYAAVLRASAPCILRPVAGFARGLLIAILVGVLANIPTQAFAVTNQLPADLPPASSSQTPIAAADTPAAAVVKMQVMGVRGQADYNALLNNLWATQLVSAVDTLQMNDTRLVLAITITTGRNEFIQALSNYLQLESETADFGNGLTESSLLKYRWVRY